MPPEPTPDRLAALLAVETARGDELADAVASDNKAAEQLADARLALLDAQTTLANDGDAALSNAQLADLEHGVRYAELRATAATQRHAGAERVYRDAVIARTVAEIDDFADTRLTAMRGHYATLVAAVRDLRDGMVAWDRDLRPMKRAWSTIDSPTVTQRLAELPAFPVGSRDFTSPWFDWAVEEGQAGYRTTERYDTQRGMIYRVATHVLHSPALIADMQRRLRARQDGAPAPVIYTATQQRLR